MALTFIGATGGIGYWIGIISSHTLVALMFALFFAVVVMNFCLHRRLTSMKVKPRLIENTDEANPMIKALENKLANANEKVKSEQKETGRYRTAAVKWKEKCDKLESDLKSHPAPAANIVSKSAMYATDRIFRDDDYEQDKDRSPEELWEVIERREKLMKRD